MSSKDCWQFKTKCDKTNPQEARTCLVTSTITMRTPMNPLESQGLKSEMYYQRNQ